MLLLLLFSFSTVFSYVTYGGNAHCNFRSTYEGDLKNWDVKLDIGTKQGATLIIEDGYLIVPTYNFAQNQHYEYLLDPNTGKQISLLKRNGKKVGVMIFKSTYITFVQENPTDPWSIIAFSLPKFDVVWKVPLTNIPVDWSVDPGFALSKQYENRIIAQFYNPNDPTMTKKAKIVSIPFMGNNVTYLNLGFDLVPYHRLNLNVHGRLIMTWGNQSYLAEVDPKTGDPLAFSILPFLGERETMGALASTNTGSYFYIPVRDSHVSKWSQSGFHSLWEMEPLVHFKCTNVAFSDDETKLYMACDTADGIPSVVMTNVNSGEAEISEIPNANGTYCAFNEYKGSGVHSYSNPGGVVMAGGSVFFQCNNKAFLFSEDLSKLLYTLEYEKGFTDALLSPIGDARDCVYYCLNPPSQDLGMSCHKRCSFVKK